MEFTLRLHKMYLHEDLERIRANRERLQDVDLTQSFNELEDKMNKIILEFDGSSIVLETLTQNLWVVGYRQAVDEPVHYFGTGPQDRHLNYREGTETGCVLDLNSIQQTIRKVRNYTKPDDFYGNATEARRAYIMCVFVASEMVRNEFLERIVLDWEHLNAKYDSQFKGNWQDYLLLYKNWARTVKTLHCIERDGIFLPHIKVSDTNSLFVRITTDEDLFREVGTCYDRLLVQFGEKKKLYKE